MAYEMKDDKSGLSRGLYSLISSPQVGSVAELSVAGGERPDCPNVYNFLYDPNYCDAGFWCGCYDPTGETCKPSNVLNETSWAGQYTDPTTGVVYVGWADSTQTSGTNATFPKDYFQCSDTLYCPGSQDTTSCPRLCAPGYYCPNATVQLPCPDGHYCLTGSTEPTPCSGVMRCNGTGKDIYSAGIAFAIVIVVAVILYVFVVAGYKYLNRNRAPKSETEKLTNGMPEKATQSADIETDMSSGKDFRVRQSTLCIKEAPATQLDIKFHDLQLTLPNGKTIMQGVSGQLLKGQFTAVMGPSGAGKSTFLSILSGKVDRTAGRLLINDQPSELTKYRRIIGFVPQEDIMLRSLSVEENVRHSAFMRLPADWSKEKKLARVEQVLRSLELTEIRHSIIGDEMKRGISGGQRKRVNVAMELVADPSLLCLDEPTSGLDSTTSFALTQTLHELSKTGVNVVAVLHQPKNEIFEQFDNVLLLGVGGRTVYLGPASEMTDYFARIGFPLPPRTNPCDFVMDVVAGIVPCEKDPNFKKEDLFTLWEQAEENPNRDDDAQHSVMVTNKEEEKGFLADKCAGFAFYCKSLYRHMFSEFHKELNEYRKTPGFLSQTWILFRRAVLQRFREPQNTFWPMLLALFAGGVAGLATHAYGLTGDKPLYYGIPWAMVPGDNPKASNYFLLNNPNQQDNIVGTWQNIVLAVMLVCVLSVNVFGSERTVFFRDVASGTRVASYWTAKTLETFLWLPIYSALFAVICYTIQPMVLSLSHFWLVIWMAYIGFYGLGGMFSLIIGAANRGIVFLVGGLILILAFSGLIFAYGGNKGKELFLFKLFYTFWCAQGFASQNYQNYDPPFDTELYNQRVAGYDLSYSFALNIVFSLLTGLAWHVVTLILLKTADFRKQR